MTNAISVRVPVETLARIAGRAQELGFADRSKYLMALVERDLAEPPPAKARKRASTRLLGSASVGAGPATNERVRQIIASRRSRHEKHR